MHIPEPEFLQHSGVKGMKWGIRKDAKWERKVTNVRSAQKLMNSALPGINKELTDLRSKYGEKNLNSDPALKAKYHNEAQKSFNEHLNKAAEAKGTNPSGTKKVVASLTSDGFLHVRFAEIKHYSEIDSPATFQLITDKNGYFIGVKVITVQKKPEVRR